MIIKSIKLFNFRNHSEYSLNCQDETSLILGENGSGKTSVLEAIYILTRGKSFRATDPEIIKRGTDYYRIELEYINGETYTATYDGTTKTFLIMDKKSRRLPKKHKYPVVLFQPSDLMHKFIPFTADYAILNPPPELFASLVSSMKNTVKVYLSMKNL